MKLFLLPMALLFTMSRGISSQAVARALPVGQAETLDGGKLAVPAFLGEKNTVMVVGFSQASREQVTGWGKRLGGDPAFAGASAWYQGAMLAAVPRLLRGTVLRKIRSDVSDGAKPHFVALLDHEAEWKAVTGYGAGAGDDAYVVVVDGAGVVRYVTHGAVDEGKFGEVKREAGVLGRG